VRVDRTGARKGEALALLRARGALPLAVAPSRSRCDRIGTAAEPRLGPAAQ
jgi:hypothetical protein